MCYGVGATDVVITKLVQETKLGILLQPDDETDTAGGTWMGEVSNRHGGLYVDG